MDCKAVPLWLQLDGVLRCFDAVFPCGQAQNMAGKMVGISFPISAFVAIGFDHIPADMFMVPLGLLAGAARACWRCSTRTSSPTTLNKILRGTSSSPPSRALAATGWFA